jgi:hypothetical protein
LQKELLERAKQRKLGWKIEGILAKFFMMTMPTVLFVVCFVEEGRELTGMNSA